MCKQAYHTRAEVKDSVLRFNNLIDKVLNGTFHLILPSTFKKVQGTISVAESKSNEPNKKEAEMVIRSKRTKTETET